MELWRGITGTECVVTHTHVYTAMGVFMVSLTATGLGGADALTRTGCVTVSGGYTTTVITYIYPWLVTA